MLSTLNAGSLALHRRALTSRRARRTCAAMGAVGDASGKPIHVSDAMVRNPITFTEDENLGVAMRRLLTSRISGAPVVDKDGRCVGVLSESDLLWREAGAPNEEWRIPPIMLPLLGEVVAWRDSEKFFSEVRKMLATNVGDAMTQKDKLVTIRGDVSLQECAQIMCRKRITRLPVLDADQRLVGIISRTDIVRVLAAHPDSMLPV